MSIETEEQYQTAMSEILLLIDAEPVPGTAEGERLDTLVTAVEAYEKAHWDSPAVRSFYEEPPK